MKNVINSCFDKEPFELYFSKVFYTENSNKINEIKNDVYPSFKENFTFENNRDKAKLIFKDKTDKKFKNKLVKAFCNMHLQYYIDIHKIL